jgi:AAA domain
MDKPPIWAGEPELEEAAEAERAKARDEEMLERIERIERELGLRSGQKRPAPNGRDAEGRGEDQPPSCRLKVLTAGELLMMDIPEREMLLAPIIPAKGIVMFYSKRGVGKTFVALCVAYAVASGGAYLRWKAPIPRRVLLIDGEMPLVTLKERLANIALSSATEPPSPEYIRIIAADHQDHGIPDLSTKEGVEAVEEHITDGVDLVILDNLSTLCRGGKENESESWAPIRNGCSVYGAARSRSSLCITQARAVRSAAQASARMSSTPSSCCGIRTITALPTAPVSRCISTRPAAFMAIRRSLSRLS